MPLRLSVLGSIADSGGIHRRRCAPQHRGSGAARRPLGYQRYWVAEHHGTPMLASPSPEVLIVAIGAATTDVRVGSGGVMLPHYSPLKVAETFSMLSGLYPGPHRSRGRPRAGNRPDDDVRVAARSPPGGAGRLPGATGRAARPTSATACRRAPVRAAGRAARTARPGRSRGCSGRRRRAALGRGGRVAVRVRRLHHPRGCADRTALSPGVPAVPTLQSPYVIVAAWALCAETDEEAARLASSARMAFTLMRQGELIPIPPVETAERFFAEHGTATVPITNRRRWILGSPSTVRMALAALAEEYAADEIMIATITHDHQGAATVV